MSGVGGASPEPRDEDFGEVFEVEPPTLDEQIADAADVWSEADREYWEAHEANAELKRLGALASDRESRAFAARKAANEALMSLVHKQIRARARVGAEGADRVQD